MPQQPVDDWTDVVDDWQDVPAAPPVQESSSWFDSFSDYIPTPVKEAANWAVSPLTDAPSQAGKAIGNQFYEARKTSDNPWYAGLAGFYEGASEAAGDVLSGFTSPLNLATAGAFGGASVAARQGIPAAARGLTAVGRGLSAPVVAQGGYHTATAQDPTQALMGVAEVAGGLAGVGQKIPARVPTPAGALDLPPVKPPAVSDAFQGGRAGIVPPKAAPINPRSGIEVPAAPGSKAASFADQVLKKEFEPLPIKEGESISDYIRRNGVETIDTTADEALANQARMQYGAKGTEDFSQSPYGPEYASDPEFPDLTPEQFADAPIVSFPNELVRRGMDPRMMARAQQGTIPEFNPAQLQGLRPTPKQVLEFLDPKTGETVPASQARPGMIPLPLDESVDPYTIAKRNLDERNESGGVVDYQEELANLNEQHGVIETMSEETRGITNEIMQANDEGFSVYPPKFQGKITGRVVRTLSDGSRVVQERGAAAQAMPEAAPANVSDWIERLIKEESGELDTGAIIGRIQRKGKTLDEVEAGKKGSGLQRLGKLIGEDRAQQLRSGEKTIDFSEKPMRLPKSKKLPGGTVKEWSEWGDNQINQLAPDPSKPGLSFGEMEPVGLFPGAFKIAYRDAQGNPIGVLATDMQGGGISTLAVRSDLGLRRGKVAFEMIKQALDRGVTEPSGATSDFTRNLIERVKRLVSSESGELDFDTLFKELNKMMGGVAESKAGKLAGRFIREEGGELNLPRLTELFEKQKAGILSADELAEAKQLARETKRPEMPAPAAKVPSGPFENITPEQVTQSLSDRLKKASEDPNVAPEEIQEMLKDLDEVIRLNPDIDKPGLIRQVLGVNKALLTSWDLSAPGRQGKAFILEKSWRSSIIPMVKAWGSKKAADTIQQSIIDHPSGYFKRGVNAAGKETKSFHERMGLDLALREEAFNTPFLKKFQERLGVEKSSRAHTAFLNKLRSDQFVSMMEAAKKVGLDPETNLTIAKTYADFINSATGRGGLDIGKWKLSRNTAALNDVFFAPKNLSGQIRTWNNVLNPVKYYNYDPVMRKQALKSLFAVAGAGLGVTGMANMAGVNVSFNPVSSDFLKLKFGDTRVDLFGGYQQFPVAAAKFMSGLSTSTLPNKKGHLVTTDLTAGKYGQQTRETIAERFFTNRLSPLGSFVYAWMSNREFDGKPFEFKRAAFERVFPIAAKDIQELAAEDPFLAGVLAPTTIMGLTATQHYTGR